MNYREAAALLGVELREIRGLVAGGILRDAVEYQFGSRNCCRPQKCDVLPKTTYQYLPSPSDIASTQLPLSAT